MKINTVSGVDELSGKARKNSSSSICMYFHFKLERGRVKKGNKGDRMKIKSVEG